MKQLLYFEYHHIAHSQIPSKIFHSLRESQADQFINVLTVRPHLLALSTLAHQYDGPHVHGLLPIGARVVVVVLVSL